MASSEIPSRFECLSDSLLVFVYWSACLLVCLPGHTWVLVGFPGVQYKYLSNVFLPT